jgi:UDP-N-acetylmuramate--alanine ligase
LVDINDFKGKTLHFIGIGGSSMSGLARLMISRGYLVRGSDQSDSYTTRALQNEGVKVAIGHDAQNVHGADLIIYTAAAAQDNVERLEGARQDIPSLERKELLGQISNAYSRSVAISGTHGKTTATSMLAQVLVDAGMDPNIHIGGVLDAIGGSVRTGKSNIFVTEADEFARSFLELNPTISIILNIDADHLDCYKDIDDIQQTFLQFAKRLPKDGLLIVYGDDPRCIQVAKDSGRSYITFGASPSFDYSFANEVMDENACYSFDLLHAGKKISRVSLIVPGMHSVIDALAVFACADRLGVKLPKAAEIMSAFKGAHRRFELTGVVDGVRLYHDYSHNPSEYKTVVPIAAHLPHNRLYVVFQPHTYSRSKALIDDFGPSFVGADEVLITDIYAAREKDPGDIHSRMLIEKMQGNGYKIVYCPGFKECDEYLKANWREGDIVLTVGCGNVNILNDILAEEK